MQPAILVHACAISLLDQNHTCVFEACSPPTSPPAVPLEAGAASTGLLTGNSVCACAHAFVQEVQPSGFLHMAHRLLASMTSLMRQPSVLHAVAGSRLRGGLK